MKRIDFSRIKLEVEPGRFEVLDQRRAFGNAIYAESFTLDVDALARKVYFAPAGKEETFSDDEFALLIQRLTGKFIYSIIRDVKNAAIDVTKIDEAGTLSIRYNITEEGGRTMELNASIEREDRNLGSVSAFPDGQISFYLDKGSNLTEAEKKATFAAIVDEVASAFRPASGTSEKKA